MYPLPLYRHLVVKSGTKLCLVDLSSDIPLVLHLVAKSGSKLNLFDLSSDIPPDRGI